MKCMDCPQKYIGQRGRTYIQAIRNNNDNSGYPNHILNTGHAYGSVTDILKIIKIEEKGKHLDTLEKYHKYIKLIKTYYTRMTHILTSIAQYSKHCKN
jgi:hypothetical protein